MPPLTNVPQYVRRAWCVEQLRKAGLTDYAIDEGMRHLPKYHILGSKRAQYKVNEFLSAFGLPAPASSKSS
jgi:hypothetical protein